MRGLEIGTGDKPTKIEGVEFVHTDKFPVNENIYYLNADNALPFSDDDLDYVVAYGVLEHVTDFYYTINEIHRVLKPGGILKCDLPHFAGSQQYWEPDHKRTGHSRTFHSYVEEQGDKGMSQQSQNRKFELIRFDYCINLGTILKPIINLNFTYYEKYWARVLPFNIDMIWFTLKKVKDWDTE